MHLAAQAGVAELIDAGDQTSSAEQGTLLAKPWVALLKPLAVAPSAGGD